jgi:hypothetical protein
MFVRWQKRNRKSRAFGRGQGGDTHWSAILVESTRINGEPRLLHGEPRLLHIAYLGGITESAIEIAIQRAFFWGGVMAQLDRLASRISKDARARFEGSIEEKVPRLTREEYDDSLARRAALGFEKHEFPSFKNCGRVRA